MAYSGSGIIFWLGDYGGGDKKTKQMRLPFLSGSVPDHTDLNSLRTALQPYTEAACGGFERLLKKTLTATSPDTGANLDVKARIAFKDSSDGKIYRIEIPAPVASMFEIQGEGDRVTSVALADIVSSLATAFNRTFIPLWGKKIQRS